MPIFKIEKTEAQFIVSWRHYSPLTIYSCILFVLGMFICPLGFYQLFETNVWLGVFGLLLILGSIRYVVKYIVEYIINNYFGRTMLVLDDNGLKSTWTFFSFQREQWIVLDKICRFDRQDYQAGYYGKATRWHRWLYVICTDKNIGFLTSAGLRDWSRGELNSLCVQLNDFLNELTSIEEEQL